MSMTGLTFGIYPLGVAGTPTGLAVGPKDAYEKIQQALQALKGEGKTLLVRTYIVYMGEDTVDKMLAAAERYARAGLLGDLTIGVHGSNSDLKGWLAFVRTIVREYGAELASLQITNEPNLSFMEGANPNIRKVLVEGVITAKEEARAGNLPVKIGFGSVPDSEHAVPHFWEDLAETGGNTFVDSVDYVAHNFYVDMFEASLPLAEIPVTVEHTLRKLREEHLAAAGIPPAVPIRIGENGWPTGRHPLTGELRTGERQAEVLEAVIRTVHRLRGELNITHYSLFGLRDADSSKDDIFHQFGIMRDDYTPKPAFYKYQNLIKELGV